MNDSRDFPIAQWCANSLDDSAAFALLSPLSGMLSPYFYMVSCYLSLKGCWNTSLPLLLFVELFSSTGGGEGSCAEDREVHGQKEQ